MQSALKRDEVLTQATTWMNLENIMLSERTQTQQATEDMVPLTPNVQTSQIHKEKMSDCWGLAEKGSGLATNRCRGSLGGDETVLESSSADGCTSLYRLRPTELHT